MTLLWILLTLCFTIGFALAISFFYFRHVHQSQTNANNSTFEHTPNQDLESQLNNAQIINEKFNRLWNNYTSALDNMSQKIDELNTIYDNFIKFFKLHDSNPNVVSALEHQLTKLDECCKIILSEKEALAHNSSDNSIEMLEAQIREIHEFLEFIALKKNVVLQLALKYDLPDPTIEKNEHESTKNVAYI